MTLVTNALSQALDASTRQARGAQCAHHDHVVQFYDNEEFLYEVVGKFLGEGLILGQPLIVISTPVHLSAFVGHLRSSGFDMDELYATGQVVLLDADETLASFMV